MKKLLSMTLALAMVLTLLAGCGGGGNNQSGGQNNNQNNQSQQENNNTPDDTNTPEDTNEPASDVTIQVAALASGYEETYPGMWQEVCDAFTAQTGIKVELIVDKMLEDVIGPSMQGGDFPDVIHLAVGREKGLTEQFIKDRNLVDLTSVLSMTVPGESAKVGDKIAGGFTDTSVTNPYGDESSATYLAPMFYSPCGLFYNTAMFKSDDKTDEENAELYDLPTTWDEMWELAESLPEGTYLFTYPTTGYFDAFLYALMYSVGGPEFYNKALRYEEGIWDTPEAQECFDIIEKLASYTNPVTPAQANDQDFTQNQQLVLDNKALFMPNGTWIVGEMAEAPRADGFKWGMTALPAAKAGGNGASYCWMEQAWIPAGAPNQEAAKQFVAFLYSDTACDIFAKGGAIQPVLGVAENMEGDNKMFYSIYDNGADAAMGNFAACKPEAGLRSIREVFLDPVNGLVNGSVTKDQWISDIKAASDQMRANIMG